MSTGVIIFLILLLLFAIGGGFGAYYYYKSESTIAKFINDNYSKPGNYGSDCSHVDYLPNGLLEVQKDKIISRFSRTEISAKIKKQDDTSISLQIDREPIELKLVGGKLMHLVNKNGKSFWEPFPIKRCQK